MTPKRIIHCTNFNFIKRIGAYMNICPYKISHGLIRNGHNVLDFSDRDILKTFAVFGKLKQLGKKSFNELFYKYCVDTNPDGIILGHAVGRVGCFCAGCCYGEITDSKIGVVFPGDADLMKSKNGIYRIEINGSDGYRNLFEQELNRIGFDENKIYTDYNEINYYYTTAKIYADNTKLLPTQLIETVFLLALFGLLYLIKHYQMPLYVIGYGIFRFLIEYKRFDNRGSTTLGISPSQLLSIIIIIFGFVLIGVYYYLNKKKQIEI